MAIKKKKKHTSPMEYRISYRINGDLGECTQYYNVYHSSEALDFLAHTFRRGHIEGEELRVVAVEEYNKYSDKWEDRTLKASAHDEAPEVSLSPVHEVFLIKKEIKV